MKFLLMPFAWLLLVFYNLFNNYGVAIILFALVVKVVLFPFALKGKRSMVKMTSLQGRANRIQKQYANNKLKQQEELQALYDREHVNPMSGCLWSFVPLLVLIPLYAILREPLVYLMNATKEQVTALLPVLDWSGTAAANHWAADFAKAPYGQLQLSSLIDARNLAAVQDHVPGAFVLNFDFLGMSLAQQPQWDIWNQPLTWNNVGLFLMPIVSAAMSLVFSIVMNKTNNINNPDGAKNNNVFMTYIFSPLMSLWIGYAMPAGLCVYWIANSVLSMIQELIAAKLLKKDYEAAAEARRQQELLDKEEEKRKKELLRQERAKRAEEKKKGGKKKKDAKETAEPGVDASASRVGLRTYARGRAYDPNRFGGVTPYKDPDQAVDEDAIEKAREAKAEQAEEAQLEAEITAKVAAEVEAEYAAGTLKEKTPEEVAAEAEAEADALADSLTKAEETLEDAWEEVTADAATQDEHSGDEAPKEE